jgi:hypothetical protein
VLLLLKFIKVLSVAALFSGTVGALWTRDLGDRRRFAYALAGPGFGVTWLCGFGLAAYEEVPILSGWILGAMALSLLSLQVVLYAVGKDGRRTVGTALVALLPLAATVALMVWRP